MLLISLRIRGSTMSSKRKDRVQKNSSEFIEWKPPQLCRGSALSAHLTKISAAPAQSKAPTALSAHTLNISFLAVLEKQEHSSPRAGSSFLPGFCYGFPPGLVLLDAILQPGSHYPVYSCLCCWAR